MEDFSNAMELKQLLPETALPVPDSVLSRYRHFLPLPFFLTNELLHVSCGTQNLYPEWDIFETREKVVVAGFPH